MMDWTDRHCRYFHRQLSNHALLYTEMLTTGAVLHGDRARLMAFDPAERPVALQLGGCEPRELAESARIGADMGYAEINLNVGCPSDRVQNGRFGACLMAEPARVADAVAAMKAAVNVPVTVKCRLGIDEQDIEAPLDEFARGVIEAGADALIVHARKAWLKGLSPRENREVPPLNHERVYRLKQKFPNATIVINGGVRTLAEAQEHLAHVDGVMLGRAAYENPGLLIDVDPVLFGDDAPSAGIHEAVEKMIPYIARELGRGVHLHNITRHLLGLFRGQPGARRFRRHLSTEAVKPGAGLDVLREALSFVQQREGFAQIAAE